MGEALQALQDGVLPALPRPHSASAKLTQAEALSAWGSDTPRETATAPAPASSHLEDNGDAPLFAMAPSASKLYNDSISAWGVNLGAGLPLKRSSTGSRLALSLEEVLSV